MTFGRFLAIILILGVFVHTVSFGAWNWKKNKNKFGAVIVMLLALISLIMPIFIMLFRVR